MLECDSEPVLGSTLSESELALGSSMSECVHATESLSSFLGLRLQACFFDQNYALLAARLFLD